MNKWINCMPQSQSKNSQHNFRKNLVPFFQNVISKMENFKYLTFYRSIMQLIILKDLKQNKWKNSRLKSTAWYSEFKGKLRNKLKIKNANSGDLIWILSVTFAIFHICYSQISCKYPNYFYLIIGVSGICIKQTVI